MSRPGAPWLLHVCPTDPLAGFQGKRSLGAFPTLGAIRVDVPVAEQEGGAGEADATFWAGVVSWVCVCVPVNGLRCLWQKHHEQPQHR